MSTLKSACPFILDPMSQLFLLVETWARTSLTDGRVNIYNLKCVLCDTVLIYSLISIRCTPNSEKLDFWKRNKNKKRKKSETTRPVGKKIRDSEVQKNMQKRDFETLKKRFRDLEIRPKFSETNVFWGTIHHPYIKEAYYQIPKVRLEIGGIC